MSFFDKLAFWKKDEDVFGGDIPGLGPEPPGLGPMPGEKGIPGEEKGLFDNKGLPPLGEESQGPSSSALPPLGGEEQRPGFDFDDLKKPAGMPRAFTPAEPASAPGPAPSYSPQQDITNKTLDMLGSKIDALRATLESMNQRLVNIELIAKGEQEQSNRKKWY